MSTGTTELEADKDTALIVNVSAAKLRAALVALHLVTDNNGPIVQLRSVAVTVELDPATNQQALIQRATDRVRLVRVALPLLEPIAMVFPPVLISAAAVKTLLAGMAKPKATDVDLPAAIEWHIGAETFSVTVGYLGARNTVGFTYPDDSFVRPATLDRMIPDISDHTDNPRLNLSAATIALVGRVTAAYGRDARIVITAMSETGAYRFDLPAHPEFTLVTMPMRVPR